MNITEVRVKLMQDRTDRLRAFCSMTIDGDFVVHDLRVIEGRKGFFVAMPSRKLSEACPRCGGKNPLRSKFCNLCGAQLPPPKPGREGAQKLHVDIAHPITPACRQLLQERILEAYREEERRARQGLPPRHEYRVEGLEDLADEYAEGDVEEPDAGAPEPQGGPAEGKLPGRPAGGRRQGEQEASSEEGAFGEGIF